MNTDPVTASLVPRPFLRTREEFEIRGRRKAAFLRPLISNSSRVRRKGLGTRLVTAPPPTRTSFTRGGAGSQLTLHDQTAVVVWFVMNTCYTRIDKSMVTTR